MVVFERQASTLLKTSLYSHFDFLDLIYKDIFMLKLHKVCVLFLLGSSILTPFLAFGSYSPTICNGVVCNPANQEYICGMKNPYNSNPAAAILEVCLCYPKFDQEPNGCEWMDIQGLSSFLVGGQPLPNPPFMIKRMTPQPPLQ
jgi:hypothetical protein